MEGAYTSPSGTPMPRPSNVKLFWAPITDNPNNANNGESDGQENGKWNGNNRSSQIGIAWEGPGR